MKKLITAGLTLLLLSGCATRERYENEVQAFVGQNISAVMASWGYPSGSFESPTGNLVYVWDRQSSYVSPPTVQTTIFTGHGRGGFATGFGYGFGGRVDTLRCQTFFEVDKDKQVIGWRVQGNDCRR